MNVLLIIADDLGWSDVGFNNKEIHTPNLDYIAQNYTKFNKFYTQPVCTTTRVSIYTGDYAFKHGFDGVIWPWTDYGLQKKHNLPNTFKNNNYNTYLVGKWHVGHSRKKYLPTSLGFEYHYGNHTGCLDHWNHTYYNVHDFHENGKPIYPAGHTTDLYAGKAIEILKNRSKEKPFFMCLAFNAPHVPLQTHDEFIKKYKFQNQNRNIFSAMVTHMDQKIGEIINVLKKENYYDDTVIWFTSDNGGWLGEFGGTNFPLKEGKISFYEGGIRVVNVAKTPMGHKEFDNVCHAIDIFPTLCDFCNIECPNKEADGISIFNNNKSRDLIHHVKFMRDDFVGCIRSGDWKYIKYKQEELYNLEIDPYEKNNLIKTNVDLVDCLKQKLYSQKSNYKDCEIKWFEPNGYPVDFKFPKYWGPNKLNKKIKMLNCQEHERINLSMSEALGLNY